MEVAQALVAGVITTTVEVVALEMVAIHRQSRQLRRLQQRQEKLTHRRTISNVQWPMSWSGVDILD